jgi:hypothetical protein
VPYATDLIAGASNYFKAVPDQQGDPLAALLAGRKDRGAHRNSSSCRGRCTPPLPLSLGAMVQDLIWSLFAEIAVGGAFSVVVAAALSQPVRNLTLSGIFARLLVVGAPIYLAADYAIYHGVLPTAFVATSFIFGLYCLRDWWASEHFVQPIGSRIWATVNAMRHVQPAILPSDALRHRMLGVVRADRQLQRQTRDRSLPKAA